MLAEIAQFCRLSDDIGAILGPLGLGLHAALSFDLICEDVLITGAGPIGITATAGTKQIGVRHFAISDTNPERSTLVAKVAEVS